MPVPINVHLPLDLHIHRHNGDDEDDVELTIGDGEIVTLRPNKVAQYIKKYLKDVLPGKIKDKTGFDVEAAPDG